MQLWDGMESRRGARIIVMGATNRPYMLDEAVLRRFSIQHEVRLCCAVGGRTTPEPATRHMLAHPAPAYTPHGLISHQSAPANFIHSLVNE